jgi:hypothetical protein
MQSSLFTVSSMASEKIDLSAAAVFRFPDDQHRVKKSLVYFNGFFDRLGPISGVRRSKSPRDRLNVQSHATSGFTYSLH